MTSEELGALPPRMSTDGPGPASRELARRLRDVESRNVTHLSDDFPVFWSEARGANVRDADGNVYVDLTGAFGVALTGHRDASLVDALEAQAGRLVHGMGDVHPPAIKVELLERLVDFLPWDDSRVVLSSTGSEAVETALKTALMATDLPGILTFEGGYHGLTLGALATTARPYFREPFRERLYQGVAEVAFPAASGDEAGRPEAVLHEVERLLREGAPNGDPIGAVIVEPVQGRAGIRVAPEGFFPDLAERVRDAGALLVADEIFTGCGRAGAFLASERVGLEPDLVCLGKALGGGLPLSVCAGPARVMDAWPASPGEALHTSTFLGHPLSCAAALAFLDRLGEVDVAGRARERGKALRRLIDEALSGVEGVLEVRGVGLMLGVELEVGNGEGRRDDRESDGAPGPAVETATRALAEGVLVLPAGAEGEVVELTPPVTITDAQLEAAVEILARAIRKTVAA